MRSFRHLSFPRSFFCFSQVAGVWTPTTLPAASFHHEQPPPSVPSRGDLPFPQEAPPAFLLCTSCSGQERWQSCPHAWKRTKGLRNHKEWDFESLLQVLARYPCPPCLPDPWCIITCSSQLFFRYM